MNILHATPADLPRIRRLMQRGRHAFQNLGHEDWQTLLSRGLVMLGVAEGDGLLGSGLLSSQTPVAVLGLRLEERPSTLPSDALSRAYVTCGAVARGRSAISDIPALAEAAIATLQTTSPATASHQRESTGWQLIYYDADNWLVRPLLAAGFTQIDRVQFLELRQLSRRVDEISARLSQSVAEIVDSNGQYSAVDLRPAGVDDVEPIAALDSEAFEPLWHMGTRSLIELLLGCHVCVAVGQDTDGGNRLLGYAALCGLDSGDLLRSEAMLARLAVHPQTQGRGIGRRLLLDALSAAHARGVETVVLNTQTSNARSRSLYHSLGFRRTGEIFPVLTRTVTPQQHIKPR